MRLTLYYLTRTVKNQIRKIFRTWVAVFLLVCLLIGVIFGMGAAALTSLFEEDEVVEEEVVEDLAPIEELSPEEIAAIVELITGGILLAVLAFSAFFADKSGSSIFLMADVNLLFQAPLKPQSVLLFRLIMQAGTSFLATIYLLFQLPNLILNLGLSAGTAFAIVGAWFLLMLYAKLLSVLLYTVSSTSKRLKSRLRPALYAIFGALALAFILYAQGFHGNWFAAALSFFNAPVTRFIPVWGWLKALVVFALAGRVWAALIALAALLIFAVLLVLIIRRIKADFYEEAMARSEETAALRAAQADGGKTLAKRKKDRGERIKRGGLSRGYGATVYFHKAFYNRLRFSLFGIFTKTATTYLTLAVGTCALLIFAVKSPFFPAVALVLAGVAFFRALGNPIAKDAEQESFFLIPDTAHRKVFYSFLAGMTDSAIDLAPAFLVSALLLRANPATVLLWYLLTVSVGAFCSSVGLFIDLSLSTGISQIVKSLVQVMFVYFGLAPTAVLIILGFAFDALLLFAGIAIVLNLAITALSLALSPLFIIRGKK